MKLPVKIANKSSVKLSSKMNSKFPQQLQPHLWLAISCVFENLLDNIYDGVTFNIFEIFKNFISYIHLQFLKLFRNFQDENRR